MAFHNAPDFELKLLIKELVLNYKIACFVKLYTLQYGALVARIFDSLGGLNNY